MNPITVDLASGTGNFSQGFVEFGWEVERYDNDPRFKNVPFTKTIDLFDVKKINADMVVASPPCEAFSIAAFGHHWLPGYVPRTEHAKRSIRLVEHIQGLIAGSGCRYWVIENPRGMLRKVIGPPVLTTWWCRWGDDRAKPTDLWGVFPPSLDFPEPCRNNNPECHHQRARRGAKSGTQGLKDRADRARIPIQFSRALAEACDREFR